MSEHIYFFINYFPPEILNEVFTRLPIRDLMNCRAVCSYWQTIIDKLTCTEILWHNMCRKDFPDIYESAYRKSSPRLSWHLLYKSLKVWPNLPHVWERRESFATAQCVPDEIQCFVLISDDIIGVQKLRNIVYYNRNTLQEQKIVTGNFIKYSENENVVVILHGHLVLSVYWKSIPNRSPRYADFTDVIMFIILEDVIYYISKYFVLYKCEPVDDIVVKTVIAPLITGPVSLSHRNGFLHVIMQYNIYMLINNKLVPVMNYDPVDTRLYPALKKYNLLRYIDWSMHFYYYTTYESRFSYYQILLGLGISVIFPYGLVTLVGNNYGKLSFYHTSEINDFWDFYEVEPLKVYDFVDNLLNFDQCWFVANLKLCPIIQVDIVESEDGHKLFVATPQRITIMTIIDELLTAKFSCNLSGSGGSRAK